MHQGSAILSESVEPVRIAALGKAWEMQSVDLLDLTQRLPRRMFPLTAGGWNQALCCGGQWQNDKKSGDSNQVQRSHKELLCYLKADTQNTLPDTKGKNLISF